jgi:hypothetical protein
MRDELFDELVESIREAGAYLRGEAPPERREAPRDHPESGMTRRRAHPAADDTASTWRRRQRG